MLPFERLRSLARSPGDDLDLVHEAADCLGTFGADAPQLVTACRRLLEHHPSYGPLWWLCARILAAPDTAAGAREARMALDHDRTSDRLTAALPFALDEPIVVIGWPPVITRALQERPDLEVVVVEHDPRRRRRRRHLDAPVTVLAPGAVDDSVASYILVEPVAASPTRALVPHGTSTVRLGLDRAAVWLVVPTGRLLPERLFASLERATGEHIDELGLEPMAFDGSGGVGPPAGFVTSQGFDTLERLTRRVDCAPVPELVRR